MISMSAETLLVEDDRAYARVVQYAIRKARPECRIHHVTDGEEALDFIYGRGAYAARSAGPLPELVLLDLRMPRVDGFEVLSQIKTDPRTRAIPVVVMTSSDLESDRRRCLESGADMFLTKPVSFPELFLQISQRRDRGAA